MLVPHRMQLVKRWLSRFVSECVIPTASQPDRRSTASQQQYRQRLTEVPLGRAREHYLVERLYPDREVLGRLDVRG